MRGESMIGLFFLFFRGGKEKEMGAGPAVESVFFFLFFLRRGGG